MARLVALLLTHPASRHEGTGVSSDEKERASEIASKRTRVLSHKELDPFGQCAVTERTQRAYD